MVERAKKKTGPRCRTIGGVVYDLTATDREPPCRRAAPKKPAAKPAAAKKSIPPRAPSSPPARKFGGAPAVRVNDHRVLERQEREREHQRRESLEAARPAKTTLAAAGRIPAGPVLKSSERAVLDKVRKRNAAGLLYQADATSPSLTRIAIDLAKRGVLVEYGHRAFYAPEFASKLEAMAGASARLAGKTPAVAYVGVASNASVSDYDRRRQKVVPLPHSIDPAKAQRGQKVSVFNYLQNEPAHGTLTGLPGDKGYLDTVATEPTVHFESGDQAGMNRHIRWERIFTGWLDPNVNWKPWKG
jgi:hypothetical protein